MVRVFLVLHVASLFIGCCIFVCFCLLPLWMRSLRGENDWILIAPIACGVVSFATGIVLMAKRKGESESVWLAVSTILAFVLLIFASCGIAVCVR